MKNKIIYVITIVAMGLQSGTLLAQKASSDKSTYTFDRLEKRAPWIASDNAAGLVYNNALNFSTVGAYYGYQDGEYMSYNDPGKYQTFGIQTKSYVKANKVYFYGSFNYDYGIKNNQAWLGTIYPEGTLNPILDSVPGKVLREDYILSAKAGYPINENWSIGGAFDYHTATAAKRKDGRNANTLSKLSIAPGLTYHKGMITAGLNLAYQHNVEKVKYSYIGDVTGKFLYNLEGLFFNSTYGITNTSIVDRGYSTDVYGGAIQFELNNKNFKFFNQFKADYNRESDYEGLNLLKRFAFVEGLKYQYDGLLTYRSNKIDHTLALNFLSNEQLSYSVSNISEQIPGENNSWTFFEYGKTLRYMQEMQRYGAEYKGYLRRGHGMGCSWIGAVGAKYITAESDYKIYPAKYHQDYTNTEVYANLQKNIWVKTKGYFDIDLSGSYTDGKGTMLEVTNPITTGSLTQNYNLLSHDFAYKTADRAKVGFGAKYTQILNKEKGTAAYVGANYTRQFLVNDGNLNSILDGVLPGTYRQFVSVAIGLNF